MSKSDRQFPATEDIDLRALGQALWRAKGWIALLTVGAGVITFVVLSMMRPLYTSEARILIQNDELAYTRPTSDQGREQLRALDEQAVQSQVQVLTSRDLAVQVIKELDLTDNAAFAKDANITLLRRLLNSLGLGQGSPESQEEKAANTFAEHLSVFQLSKSSVIAVEYTSGDASLAAKIVNALAGAYIEWQRKAKIEQTKDATAWLSTQIEALRKRVAESEEAAEEFRASKGLYQGTNNVTLNAQQLSELNSQLILAGAQKSEAQARARLIKKMLTDNGDIDATSEVLKSTLISNLIEQRVQVQRQLAELSATLMPSHPRIQQLTSELADVRRQIRDEAGKIVKSLENESSVAAARESSLRDGLNEVKTQASGLSEAEIKLRALEREAKANRDLLELYLARYQDASARHDMGAAPAQATIVSRGHAPILPSFPKRGPVTLLVTVATALLAFTFVLARELIGEPARPVRSRREIEPRARPRRAPEPEAPHAPAVARASAASPFKPAAPAASPFTKPAASQPAPAAKGTAAVAAANAPIKGDDSRVRTKDPSTALAKVELPTFEALKSETAKRKAMNGDKSARSESTRSASAAPEPAKTETAMLGVAKATPTRPEPARAESSRAEAAKLESAKAESATAEPAKPESSKPEPAKAEPAKSESSKPDPETPAPTATPMKSGPSAGELSAAAGLLDRLRRGLSQSPAATPPTESPTGGLLSRLRPSSQATEDDRAKASRVPRTSPLRSNDLRHYLTQRIAAAAPEAANDTTRDGTTRISGPGKAKVGPVFKSLDAVFNHVLASSRGIAPRAVLVSAASLKADATQAAIGIGRALVGRREQVVLVDLTRGSPAVSGPLGLPRAPGFTDLAAGRAGFEDVVRIDEETPLQVITAGNPTVRPNGPEAASFMRVFEALTQAYDCVVLHGDREAVRKLMPALKFELPVVVTVLPPGASTVGVEDDLSAFQGLGCPVVVYEPSGDELRPDLLGRAAAAV